MDGEEIRQNVRDGYASVATRADTCCGVTPDRKLHARELGYEEADLKVIPDEANLGLGCGNPTAISQLSPGEVVLDLGSGAGMDAFLAASKVGESGHVIGVDMTPEMLARARSAATRRDVNHFVEFRCGMIEELPVTSQSVDVVISNCVINLSPDKRRVFREAYRVLKPGGRLAVSDICLSAPLPTSILELDGAYQACISGAMLADEYVEAIRRAGFVDVEATRRDASFLVDGLCADPVFQDALAKISPEELSSVRESLWSYRFFARRR